MKNLIIKPLINWLCETFYPDHIFFSRGCVRTLVTDANSHDQWSQVENLSAVMLANAVHQRHGKTALVQTDMLSCEGEDIGIWNISITRSDIT